MLALVVCSVFITSTGFAQERTKIVKNNPLGLAFSNFNVTYQSVLNESISLFFDLSYMFKLFGIEVNTFGVGAAYHYYFTYASTEVPKEFFKNPQSGLSIGSTEGDAGFTTNTIGAEVGCQWAWDSGFTPDLGIGPNYTIILGDLDDVGFDSTSGILPSATLAVGLAF